MDFGFHSGTFRDDGSVGGDLFEATVERAQWLEDEGMSFFSVMDHLWQIPINGQRTEPFFDCYTALPAIAQATEELELSALVTCPHYRNPAYLGRTIATLDAISDGRAVLGIGSGWYEAEYAALDVEFPDAATRNRQMRETIELCQAMWSQEPPASYSGEHYEMNEFVCEPRPDRDVPILVGGWGEELTLRAVAEYADRWNVPSGDPETYAHKLDVIADHCADFGRDPDAIEKTLALDTVIRDTTEAAHQAYEDLLAETENGPAGRDEHRGAVGTPAEVVEHIEEYEAVGLDTYILMAPLNDGETIERFVDEVMPAFA